MTEPPVYRLLNELEPGVLVSATLREVCRVDRLRPERSTTFGYSLADVRDSG